MLRSPTLFEDVVKTILTTNTLLWTANLVEQFGDPLLGDPDRKAFPTPERLAASTPEVLGNETRMGYRAPYIHELAGRIASGDLDPEALFSVIDNTRDQAMFLLMLRCGLRVGEVRNLSIHDLYLEPVPASLPRSWLHGKGGAPLA